MTLGSMETLSFSLLSLWYTSYNIRFSSVATFTGWTTIPELVILVIQSTVRCDRMETVFAEMSSCTALTCHTGMKTFFKTKSMKRKYLENF